MVKKTLVVVAAVTLASSCNCGKQQHNTLKPDYLPDPMALSFNACPVKDTSGNPVPDVFPDQKTLTIDNHGVVSGGLKLTVSGTDAAAFTVDQMGATGIQASSSITVKVNFAPLKSGDSKADLAISDEVDGTDDVHVTLLGSSPNLPAVATLNVKPQDWTDMMFKTGMCFVGSQCTQYYPDTLFGQSTSLQIQVTNDGCPALKITGIEMLPCPGSTGDMPFTLVSPTPPTAATPLLIATTGGTPQALLDINFAPMDDGSGNGPRCSFLRLHTNDMTVMDSDGTAGNYDIALTGDGVKPDIYTVPTTCQFSDTNDLCGNATRMPNSATFHIKNGGSAALAIDAVTFKSNGSSTSSQGGRFNIATSIVGQTIMPGGNVDLVVTHNDMPLYVTDVLTISATSPPGGAPGSGGKANIGLGGGLKPCLSTDPAIDPMSGQATLDFMMPTTDMTVKPVTVKNGAGCGTLVINNVTIDTNSFFSLIDPKIAPGTMIPPGGTAEADVLYTKPVSGGTQVGTLRIDSNDSAWAGPAYYVIQLYSSSPLDQVPVAVLDGCLPTDPTCANGMENSMSVSLSALGSNKTLIVSGQNSYDPGNTSATPISGYTFRLVTKPSNATAGALANDGMKTTSATQTLTLDPAATGLYRVTLTVYDDHNQASGTAADLKINVNQ